MWLFLPDAFYSVRAYDPVKGGVPVDEDHVVVRARVEADVQKVRDATEGWFDLAHGPDYHYHLAVPAREWVRFLEKVVVEQKDRPPMKGSGNPRSEVHMQVWNATWDLANLEPSTERPRRRS